jgi:hypothetical protein
MKRKESENPHHSIGVAGLRLPPCIAHERPIVADPKSSAAGHSENRGLGGNGRGEPGDVSGRIKMRRDDDAEQNKSRQPQNHRHDLQLPNPRSVSHRVISGSGLTETIGLPSQPSGG